MVHQSTVFAALADPVRMDIVARLAVASASVSDISAPYAMSLQAVRKHLRVLEGAGLVHSEKTGRVRCCRLRREPLEHAARWLVERGQLWEGRLDRLGALLEDEGRKS